jgi:hypothetical protein
VEQNPPRPACLCTQLLHTLRCRGRCGVADWDHQIAACIKQRLCRRRGHIVNICQASARAHLRCRRSRQTAHPVCCCTRIQQRLTRPNHCQMLTGHLFAVLIMRRANAVGWVLRAFHGKSMQVFRPHSAATSPFWYARTASTSRCFAAFMA